MLKSVYAVVISVFLLHVVVSPKPNLGLICDTSPRAKVGALFPLRNMVLYNRVYCCYDVYTHMCINLCVCIPVPASGQVSMPSVDDVEEKRMKNVKV